jgi:sulfur carrier protein
MSKIIVNGQEQTIETTSIQLLDLIKKNNVQQPDMVSVQLNGEFVLRDQYEATFVNEGDEVDFLYFMGGGEDIDYLTIYNSLF